MFKPNVSMILIVFHVTINLAMTMASFNKKSTHQDQSSVQMSHTLQSKLLEIIDQSLNDFDDITADSHLLESHLTREVNISESEFQKLARASMIQIEERVISPYRTELNRMKKTIMASNYELQRNYINDINLLLDSAVKTSGDLRETLDRYIEVLVGKSQGIIR